MATQTPFVLQPKGQVPIRSILFVLLGLLAGAVPAQQASGESAWLLGSGAISCGKWVEDRDNKHLRAQRMQWLLGYVSAYNWFQSAHQAKLSDGAAALTFVDRYCYANTQHTIAAAAAALVEELGGPKSSQAWRR